MAVETLYWKDNCVCILDQRRLPKEKVYIRCAQYQDVVNCIRDMAIRGAPAIGVAAAWGIAQAVNQSKFTDSKSFFKYLDKVYADFANSRPTAINLFWAIERMRNCVQKLKDKSLPVIRQALSKEAKKIFQEDIENNRKLGDWGAKLLPKQANVLTHCNAGALATAGYGTALGIIRSAFKQGKIKKVFVDETRPYLQGARLTAWELKEEGIPAVLITDNMSGYMMKTEKISAVIVGADRIAANGDTANKIGTYSLSILARYHNIPFYVAAPTSTIDLATPTGEKIPIEERSIQEVIKIGTYQIAPENIAVRHPAFDVTPHNLITAIICEKGIIYPPYQKNIKNYAG